MSRSGKMDLMQMLNAPPAEQARETSATSRESTTSNNSTPRPPARRQSQNLSFSNTPAHDPRPVTIPYPVEKVNSLKRSRETSPSAKAQAPIEEPRRKRQKSVEIPIWAQPAKNVKPLAKYKTQSRPPLSNHGSTSGGRSPLPPAAASTASHGEAVALPRFQGDGPLGPFERNVYGDHTLQDEITRRICDWLYTHLVPETTHLQNVEGFDGHLEIEAKIGTLLDKRTKERLVLPVTTETVLDAGLDVGFESIMTLQQHSTFNNLLNKAVEQSMGARKSADLSEVPTQRTKMAYSHTHEVDSFYDLPAGEFDPLPERLKFFIRQAYGKTPRIRVTRDQKTGKVLAKIIKIQISNLHVLSPGTYFDYRVTVNFEANWDGDVRALVQNSSPDRHKDRVSYKHDFCQIDLTQVKSEERASNKTASHELEIELDSTVAKQQCEAVRDGKPNQFPELVQTMVENMRILTRAVR